MGRALELAQRALEQGEVPVGAVVVHRGRVVGSGHNSTGKTGLPWDHAEMIALREAVRTIGYRSLENSVLYSTVEPCVMCIGAVLLARVPRVVFGAREPLTGACESVFSIPNEPRLERRPVVTGGVEEERARELMQAFFSRRRA